MGLVNLYSLSLLLPLLNCKLLNCKLMKGSSLWRFSFCFIFFLITYVDLVFHNYKSNIQCKKFINCRQSQSGKQIILCSIYPILPSFPFRHKGLHFPCCLFRRKCGHAVCTVFKCAIFSRIYLFSFIMPWNVLLWYPYLALALPLKDTKEGKWNVLNFALHLLSHFG